MRTLLTLFIFLALFKVTLGQGESEIEFVNIEIKNYLHIRKKVNLWEQSKPSIVGQKEAESIITGFLLDNFDTIKVNEILKNDSSLHINGWNGKISFAKKYLNDWNHPKDKFDVYCFCVPAFDNEKKICVFTYEIFAKDGKSSKGATVVFKKINSEWVFFKKVLG